MKTEAKRFSGRRIVHLRNRARITQAELARRCAVHEAQVSRWENGVVPGADTVGVLAAALGCDVGDLFETEQGADDEEDDRAVRLRRVAAELSERGLDRLAADLLALVVELKEPVR